MIETPLLALQEAGSILTSSLLAATGLLGFFLYRQSHRRDRAESALDKLEIESLQHRLKISEQRCSAAINCSGEGILVVMAHDLSIVELNSAARAMGGLSEGPWPKLSEICQMAVGPDETSPTNAYEWLSLIHRHRRLTFIRKDGSSLAVDADAAPIEFDSKPAYQFFLREVTDRAQLEEQLRQAQKLSTVGHMVCSIAHELCNPLAVVNGYAEILLERDDLDQSVRSQLDKVKYEANRASKLVKNFLSYSHQRPVRREAMNLNDAVRRALEISALELRDASAQTMLELDARLSLAVADGDQVQQILVNLIHNSLQALAGLERPPSLSFTTIALDEKIVLKVEDNGPGIPKNIVARIFEPYFTTKKAGVGTGLGLSIAHNIMAEHKGRIYYKQSAAGGAGFVLEFPRAAEETRASTTPVQKPKSAAAPRQEKSKNSRILILDDQETVGELLAEMIRLIGHEPVLITDPQRALEHIEDEQFDAILSDYRMPEMNGQQFFRAAVAIRPETEQRIIFLSGDLMNEETNEFLTTSGLPYIRKPFHLAKVEKALADILKAGKPISSI